MSLKLGRAPRTTCKSCKACAARQYQRRGSIDGRWTRTARSPRCLQVDPDRDKICPHRSPLFFSFSLVDAPAVAPHWRARQHYSVDALLRSLELRESVEKELLHAVGKLTSFVVVAMHNSLIACCQTWCLKIKAASPLDRRRQGRRKPRAPTVAELEKRSAEQMVLMTYQNRVASKNVGLTDRLRQIKSKGEEINVLMTCLKR